MNEIRAREKDQFESFLLIWFRRNLVRSDSKTVVFKRTEKKRKKAQSRKRSDGMLWN